MPRNVNTPRPFDGSDDLHDGRSDAQPHLHFWLDQFFSGCRVLDVGAGFGHSKARLRHNTVITYDVDARLAPYIDVAGGAMPGYPGSARWAPFDVVSAFDVLEHVEDDVSFLQDLAVRATRAVCVSTPNWHHNQCRSHHHVREYTPQEFIDVVAGVWPLDHVRLFADFKDSQGNWLEPVPLREWGEHRGRKHVLLVLMMESDRNRIDRFFAGRSHVG